MKVKFTNNRIEESALVVWRNYKGMCWNIKNLGHKSQDFWSGQKITGAQKWKQREKEKGRQNIK